MKIHEVQAKQLFREFDIPVPQGEGCFSIDEAVAVAQQLGGPVWVVKAQIHAGGRGKGGGVKIAKSIDEVEQHASDLLGMRLITHQTGAKGQTVRRLLVEQGIDIAAEYYLGMVVDRSTQRVVVMGSSEGGTEIETVAANTPEKILSISANPESGLVATEVATFVDGMGIPKAAQPQAIELVENLYRCFWENDASLAEINPLVVTPDHHVLALDAKINFDDNALFRHPELKALRDLDEEDPDEVKASNYGLNYISLDGNIGCLVNGAGLAMATMDIITLYGASPANFLDVGGGATAEQVTEAFKLMLHNPNLEAIQVNIFGGIMQCDIIAQGLVAAAREVKLSVPLVVRLEGTNVDRGREILAESEVALITATTMDDAAQKVVNAVAGGE